MENELVFIVTSFGRVLGVFRDSKDAFDCQMLQIQKNRPAEMSAYPVQDSSFKSSNS